MLIHYGQGYRRKRLTVQKGVNLKICITFRLLNYQKGINYYILGLKKMSSIVPTGRVYGFKGF